MPPHGRSGRDSTKVVAGMHPGLTVKPGFWAGKRVFVTGHTGFKGGWLSLWLQKLGAVVTGYALAPVSQPNFFQTARVVEGMSSHLGDICDLASLEGSLRDSGAEIVFHLAAQALVLQGYEQPLETYRTNVMGTATLLEAVRRVAAVKAVLVVTTDKCYDNREWYWGYRENEPLGGRDPYSSSKAAAELVTAAFRSSYFDGHTDGHANSVRRVAVASARAGNVIGGGDWGANRLLSDMVRALSAGLPAQLRHPQAIRPWQHVLDPLAGYLLLGERLHKGIGDCAQAFNFGPAPDDAKSVQWIAERFTTLWGPAASYQIDQRPTPHEANTLKLDSSKAFELLQWRARLRLPDALAHVVDWHRAHLAQEEMRAVSLGQIEAYCTNPLPEPTATT